MHRSEKGNVLFLILITISLFVALATAVTQNSQGGGKVISDEKADLHATEIMTYAKSLETAIHRMKARGVSENDICFSGCGTPSFDVFNSAGGNIQEKNLSSDISSNAWIYTGANIHTAPNNDLLLLLGGLSQDVCIALNEDTGAPLPSGLPPEEGGNILTTAYSGSFSGSTTLDNVGGRPSGCFNATQIDGVAAGDSYYFYHVLLAR